MNEKKQRRPKSQRIIKLNATAGGKPVKLVVRKNSIILRQHHSRRPLLITHQQLVDKLFKLPEQITLI